MKDEYIIINKITIQKRIEELKQICNKELGYASDKIYSELGYLLHESTPLIPVVEHAFESGVDSLQDNLIQKLGLHYQTNEVSSTTVNSTRGDLQQYIENLKLKI